MTFIDLSFLGLKRVIGTAVLEGPSGLTLVDPGPTSCLSALENGLAEAGWRLSDVRTLLLTHIHLDHAGATGTLLARLPQAVAYVHERGAPHMIDPTKLLASATRLYGENMDRLWGEFLACPASRLRVLSGGERVDLAGRTLDVQYTPGHASHHISYFDTTTGIAYVGDTAGIRVGSSGEAAPPRTPSRERYVKAPTPPPDIDLELWEESLKRIEAWRPSALVLTHFGRVDGVADHLRIFRGVLERQAAVVRNTLAMDGTDEDRIKQFVDIMRADASRAVSADEAQSADAAVAFDQLWQGLARYWRKRSAGEQVQN